MLDMCMYLTIGLSACKRFVSDAHAIINYSKLLLSLLVVYIPMQYNNFSCLHYRSSFNKCFSRTKETG